MVRRLGQRQICDDRARRQTPPRRLQHDVLRRPRPICQEIETWDVDQPRWRLVMRALFIGCFCFFAVARAIAGEPEVIKLWPNNIPDEPPPGTIGPERFRMSPGGPRTQVEVTNKTRMITGVTQPTITIYGAPADKN